MDFLAQTPAQLAVHLRSLRKAQQLTQAQLGARAGLSQTRIGKIERNPANVGIGQLMKILALLNARLVLLGPADAKRPGARRGPPPKW